MSRLLACSDLHADNYLPFSFITKRGLNSRLEDCLNTLDQINEIGKTHGVNTIIFLGDLFNSRVKINVDVMFHTYLKLRELSRNFQLILLLGNHDQYLKTGDVNSLEQFEKIAEVIKEPGFSSVPWYGYKLVFLPYAEDTTKMKKFLSGLHLFKHPALLFGHLGVNGAEVGPYDFKLPSSLNASDLLPDKFVWVFLGHYHKFQVLGKNIIYVGSMLQHDFGERGQEKSVIIFDTDHPMKLKQVELNSPKFLEITSLKSIDEKVKGNYVKVVCDKEERDEVEKKLNQLSPRGYIIEQRFIKEFQPRIELDPTLSFQEMVKKYVESSETDLDKKRLLKVVKEIMNEKT